ncbi:hypothetical protein [Nonomuraea africana]|uniref:CDP-alcohol phosphatidyltransferase family protein n=1 Tax=Nonomuraea africana TaxID=46171 RepID=A0ABR9KKG9_9ACTN|nr:hypothetical protein [Nonomuraea africana]MBE1562047.1 hypothetical protein [Nonomuraea africana]
MIDWLDTDDHQGSRLSSPHRGALNHLPVYRATTVSPAENASALEQGQALLPIEFIAAPLLLLAYGVIRILDGLDGSRGTASRVPA